MQINKKIKGKSKTVGYTTGNFYRKNHGGRIYLTLFQTFTKTVSGNKNIGFSSKDDFSVMRAEALFTSFIVEHNLDVMFFYNIYYDKF